MSVDEARIATTVSEMSAVKAVLAFGRSFPLFAFDAHPKCSVTFSYSFHELPEFCDIVQELLKIRIADFVGQAWDQRLSFFCSFAAEAPYLGVSSYSTYPYYRA